MRDFKGMGVALITPFKDDGSLDLEALKNIVRFQIDNGTDYLVVMGTTGEYVTLTPAEIEQVKNTIVAENAGKLPLVLGVGGNNTQKVIQQLKNGNYTGFDALLSVSPYYNKPTQEGIYQHFKALSENSPLPLILYNVPGRTASNILPSTVGRLARDCKNIIGIKEAAGSMDQAMKTIAATPDDFLVISGDDMLALPMTLAGGAGVISVIGNAYSRQFSTMIENGLRRKVDEAYKIHYKLTPAIDLIFEEGNPTGIKVILEEMGLAAAKVRLPLVVATSQLRTKIQRFIADHPPKISKA